MKLKTVLKILSVIPFMVITYFFISNSYVLLWEKEDVIQTTLDWGGLTELPDNIENLRIDKKGSMFTRQFIIEFEVDDLNKIDDWIKKSQRLKSNQPKLKDKVKTFEIYPGEDGASGGKVQIEGNKVRIDMSWS